MYAPKKTSLKVLGGLDSLFGPMDRLLISMRAFAAATVCGHYQAAFHSM